MRDDTWHPVRAVPPLETREVHVWRDDLAAKPPWGAHDLLSAEERDQARRFRSIARRAAFVRGRAFVRFLAGSYLGVPAAAVPIRVRPSGKPAIAVPPGTTPLEMSLAHSGPILAAAFTRDGEVGVDVEGVDPEVDRAAIARRFFSPAEAGALVALPAAAQPAAFFAAWVRKEAVLKAAGDGLAVPLAEVEMAIAPLTPGAAASLVRLPAAWGSVTEWTLHDLVPGPGMAGAVAVRAPGTRLRCLRWAGAPTLDG